MSCLHIETLAWLSPNGEVLAETKYRRSTGYCTACGTWLGTDACSCGHTASFHGDRFAPKPCVSVLCDCTEFDGTWVTGEADGD
jgi:hypothetical protein